MYNLKNLKLKDRNWSLKVGLHEFSSQAEYIFIKLISL